MFSDYHAHLVGYEPGKLEEVLEKARAEGVEMVIANGTTLETSQETVYIAQRHQGVLASIGIHPWTAVTPTGEVVEKLRELATQKNVVGMGEIGLDYVRNAEGKETQKELFRQEVHLACDIGLALNIHCREAHQDTLDILRQIGGSKLKGALHGFAGDQAMLMDWLDLGFYISIGPRAFTRSDTPAFREAVKHIPGDRLLTETDSSPNSVASGEMLGPASVVFVAEKLAALRGATAGEIGSIATANLKRLLARDR